jgi:TonB family protein
MAQERRQHTRQHVRPRPYVAVNGSSSGGILHDVSEAGMALDILGTRPPSDNVLLNFDLLEIGEHFEAKGRITWAYESANYNRVGLKFVDLSDTSLRKIRQWLSKKVVAEESSRNVAAQGGAKNVPVPVQPLIKHLEKIVVPASSRAAEARAVAEESSRNVAAQGEAKNAPVPVQPLIKHLEKIVVPASSRAAEARALRAVLSDVVRKEAATAAAVAPKTRGNTSVEPGQDERLVSGLRSSFSQMEATSSDISAGKTKPERVPFDREVLGRWITVAVVAFVLIVAVGFARWIYTSPALDKITSPGQLREMVANVFSAVTDKSEASENSRNTNPSGTKGTKPPHRETKTPGQSQARQEDASPRVKNAPAAQFEITDAQNGRIAVPRRGTAATSPLAMSDAANVAEVSGGQPASGSLMQEAGGTKVGLVVLHPSTEVPENKVLPEYPALALKKNVQGRVVLRALIDKDGALQNVRLVGPPSLLSGPVLEAVKSWRYQPHHQNGLPVEVETQITIDFEINSK